MPEFNVNTPDRHSVAELRKKAIEWLEKKENMRRVKRAGRKLITGTPYSLEDCVQAAYCIALDAVALMIRKKGELSFQRCFWALFNFHMKNLRSTSIRTISIEQLENLSIPSEALTPDEIREKAGMERMAISYAACALSGIKVRTVISILEGKTRRQIADELSLTEGAVRYHVRTATKILEEFREYGK
ncbi:MAG: hypothetical protein PHG91_09800 [Syntrophales bacterium]|nr:hypothetical protein [Syntrophales bacterium]MDD5233676.1 hypothetical protein [Syntrophales bacterium]MDD5531889.1 hypothetical protein [Syntrophales bacterium]HPL63902.1 hypothetical protein [Syntrophales bacterium]